MYLPRQSLRYILGLQARQVAAVIEDARMEQWEKDMLDFDKLFKVAAAPPPVGTSSEFRLASGSPLLGPGSCLFLLLLSWL